MRACVCVCVTTVVMWDINVKNLLSRYDCIDLVSRFDCIGIVVYLFKLICV